MLPGAHPLFEILAFAVAGRLYLSLRRRRGDAFSTDRRWVLIAAAAIGALLGSRLLAALERPALFFDPPSWLYYYANKTIVGGLLGGTVMVELAKKWLGERRRSGDLLTYPVLAGIVVGRIGCQLAGVADGTAGLPSTLPWAMDLGDGIPRHPTALYEILFLTLFGLSLRRAEGAWHLAGGRLFASFMLGYLLWRWAIEHLKPVTPLFGETVPAWSAIPWPAIPWSAIQWAAVLGSIYFAFDLWRLRWRGSDPIPTTT